MAGMIIEYDRNPQATTDQKLESLVSSIMRALEDIAPDESSGSVVVDTTFECEVDVSDEEIEEIWLLILGENVVVINCTMYVDDNGDLYMEYPDGEEPPAFRLDASGNLWLDYSEGQVAPEFIYDEETGELYYVEEI